MKTRQIRTGPMMLSAVLGVMSLGWVQQVDAQQISEAEIVNVTPSSFTVLWSVAGGEGEGSVEVYGDAAGTVNLAGEVGLEELPLKGGRPELIDAYQQRQSRRLLRQQIRGHGLMAVQVKGCAPETEYYCRVVLGEEQWPGDGSLLAVRTGRENRFVMDSKQMILTIPGADVEGRMVALSSANVSYGIAGVVGDGAGANQVYFNLDELFGVMGAENYVPLGDEEVEVRVLGEGGGAGASYTLNFGEAFRVGLAESQVLGTGSVNVELAERVVLLGEDGAVPVRLSSGAGAAEVTLELEIGEGYLSDWQVVATAGVVAEATMESSGLGRWVVRLKAAAGSTLDGDQEVAELRFHTATGKPSAFVPVRLARMEAKRGDGVGIFDLGGSSGRVVVLGREGLLEAKLSQGERKVRLYGHPGKTYQVQWSDNVKSGWANGQALVLQDYSEEWVGRAEDRVFYRAYEVGSGGPVLAIAREAGEVRLTIRGRVEQSYQVQQTDSLSGVVEWTPLLDVTLTNAVQSLDPIATANAKKFFRASEQ